MRDQRVSSPAFERNKGPILGVLQQIWGDRSGMRVLEVASGPGQHVCHYARLFADFTWQPTDASEVLCRSIDAWRRHEGLDTVLPAKKLDVRDPEAWPEGPFDAALTVNFLHMVDLDTVGLALEGIGAVLEPGGTLIVYDCFTYDGEHVSNSNAAFDVWLRRETAGGGVHEFNLVDALASEAGLGSAQVIKLPANNQCVVWTKKAITA